jgi:hypothetical protein
MNSAIFKIMPAAGGNFNAVNYNESKVKQGTGGLVYIENFGNLHEKAKVSRQEFKKYLKGYSARNKKIKNPVFHATCSCRGKELSHDELKDIALGIMEQLGYAENPILIYEHHDTSNNHIHIVSSRVGVNGKKIKDNFEGKRANHYLNAILNMDPHQEFNRHLSASLTYQFGTHAQFSLLMELKGYKIQKKEGQLLFFKHGEKQGCINLSDVDEKIKINATLKNNSSKVKALIYKYGHQYSGILWSNHDDKFTIASKKYESDLTQFLKQKFGFEFIFFSGKDKEMPYGYVLIDHNRREVYKGSELLALKILIADAKNKERASLNKVSGKEYTIPIEMNSKEERQPEDEYKIEVQLGKILDDFFEEIERTNYLGDGQAKKRRSKMRKGI